MAIKRTHPDPTVIVCDKATGEVISYQKGDPEAPVHVLIANPPLPSNPDPSQYPRVTVYGDNPGHTAHREAVAVELAREFTDERPGLCNTPSQATGNPPWYDALRSREQQEPYRVEEEVYADMYCPNCEEGSTPRVGKGRKGH